MPSSASPTGMYSMKRTCSGRSSVIFAKPSRSCLSERTTTTLSLTGEKPTSNAASSPASASSSLPPRVIARELLGVERVEAHVDALESGIAQLGGVARQQRRVGGERDALDALDRAQLADEVGHAVAHERLAAGEPDLADALAPPRCA